MKGLSFYFQLCNYQSFVERRRDTWLNIDKTKLSIILESCVIDVLENQGELEQKVVWIRLEKWNPELFSADDILQVIMSIIEKGFVILFIQFNVITFQCPLNTFSLIADIRFNLRGYLFKS